MATSVIMPRQGQSVESCILSRWHKKPGETVKTGDLLFSYETDKASFDEEAKMDGVLLVSLFNENDDVPCLAEVCRIGTDAEWSAVSISGGAVADTTAPSEVLPSASNPAVMPAEATFTDAPEARMSAMASSVPTTAHSSSVSTAAYSSSDLVSGLATFAANGNGRPAISPRARKLAEKVGVNPAFAVPTGPEGRVLERDIARLSESGFRMTPAAAAGMGQGGLSGIEGAISFSDAAQGSGLGGRMTTADLASLKENVKLRMTDMQEKGANGNPDAASANMSATGASTASAQANGSAAASSSTPAGTSDSFRDVPLPNIRKVIAKAMFQSISTTCQLTLNTSFDASSLLAMRASFKQAVQPEAAGITLTDMILFAVSRTLLSHPELNAHFLDDKMRLFDHVNLGLAVDTDRGLMVPTLFGADRMTLASLSVTAKATAKECQTGKISPDKLKGGTFTITNLGTFGIESFTPVLNAPQTGILGVCSIQTKVRDGKNGLESYPSMGLSLTFDHRALDGAPAARFLKNLTANLEQFAVMLAL